MTKKLVIFSRDFADEFRAEGFRIYDSDTFAKIEPDIELYKNHQVEWYFGTNEGFEALTLDDLMHSVTIKDITDDQASALSTMFGERKTNVYGFGQAPCLSELIERIREDSHD